MSLSDKDKATAVDKVVDHIKKLGIDKDVHAKLTPSWDQKTERRKDPVDSFFEEMEASLGGKK